MGESVRQMDLHVANYGAPAVRDDQVLLRHYFAQEEVDRAELQGRRIGEVVGILFLSWNKD